MSYRHRAQSSLQLSIHKPKPKLQHGKNYFHLQYPYKENKNYQEQKRNSSLSNYELKQQKSIIKHRSSILSLPPIDQQLNNENPSHKKYKQKNYLKQTERFQPLIYQQKDPIYHTIDQTKQSFKKNLHQNYQLLSSKIDFFNPVNQKRLDIQKRKVFIDLGIIKKDKPPVFCTKKITKSSLQIFGLLQKYIQNRQKSQILQPGFLAVGKN